MKAVLFKLVYVPGHIFSLKPRSLKIRCNVPSTVGKESVTSTLGSQKLDGQVRLPARSRQQFYQLYHSG